ncbi:hypothetical protein SAMN05660976_05616 [Nonomuraea pusilla]|uniref:4-amino-4-deoxy-L-arabinose transferase n=2 Tax=Nonomuraea pusilla TaxID=46177 RepID=A0A1H7ZWQ3_9ACTN|nr:hypothetical protein SAMN05660976_05616 [Nonomuraea pusilla]
MKLAMAIVGWVRADPWRALLALVAACYAVVQLVAVGPGMGLGWDEVVYVSQVDPRVPATDFIAPRARGITLLVAPVVLLTASTEALRVYLSLASALALYGAFLVWLRVRPGPVAPVAALLFASLWLSLFYGGEAMPNLWVAFGAVAAAGFLLRCLRPGGAVVPGRGPLVGLALCVAAVALLRPPDSLWLVLGLTPALGWAALRRAALRAALRPAVALAAGLAAGWAEWVVEAYVRFGGLAARWRDAEAANETGLHFSLYEHARALNGPLLCRPPADCGSALPPWVAWWSAIPVLVLLGLHAARRRGRPAEGLVPAVAGLSMAAPYVFLVGYAAPRFLLPAYALLALPVAHAAAGLLAKARGGTRRVGAARVAGVAVAVGCLLAHLALQGVTLDKVVAPRLAERDADAEVARALAGLGVRGPCLVYGERAVMIAYRAGCEGHTVLSWPSQSEVPGALLAARAAGKRVVAVDRGGAVPAPFLLSWERRPLEGRWFAYLPPAAPARTTPTASRPADARPLGRLTAPAPRAGAGRSGG